MRIERRETYKGEQIEACGEQIQSLPAQPTYKQILELYPQGFRTREGSNWRASAVRWPAMLRYYIRFEGVIL